MAAVHKGRGITSDAFNAVVENLVATLDKFNVPATETSELLAMLASLEPLIVECWG